MRRSISVSAWGTVVLAATGAAMAGTSAAAPASARTNAAIRRRVARERTRDRRSEFGIRQIASGTAARSNVDPVPGSRAEGPNEAGGAPWLACPDQRRRKVRARVSASATASPPSRFEPLETPQYRPARDFHGTIGPIPRTHPEDPHGRVAASPGDVERRPLVGLRAGHLRDVGLDHQAARELGVADRQPRRPDEPRGARRGGTRRVLLDGVLERAREERNAAEQARRHRGDQLRQAGRRLASHQQRSHRPRRRPGHRRRPVPGAGRGSTRRVPGQSGAQGQRRAERGRDARELTAPGPRSLSLMADTGTTYEAEASAVADVLAPNLRVVFVGINPGRISAAAGVHFANPRNDFWRLLADAGFTPRVLDPREQHELLGYGLGITNAALRTTPGSGDLRRRDFATAAERLRPIASTLEPGWLAFVGKEAFRGAFGERAAHGEQDRLIGTTRLFVLPSTSPANAAVPYVERLHWFRELAARVDGLETGHAAATRGASSAAARAS